jgi:WD40 repeat protein
VTARSQALAARAENELSIDPETSVLLARRAVREAPTREASFALREAIDGSFLRLALPNRPGATCGFQSGPSVAYRPDGRELVESLCDSAVVELDATKGRVLRTAKVSAQASSVAYSPNGSMLAVGTDQGVQLRDPATLAVLRQLDGHGEPNALAFSPDGRLLAATSDHGTTLWNVATGAARDLIVSRNNNRTLAFTGGWSAPGRRNQR